MATLRISTPVRGLDTRVAGVAFTGGVAEVEADAINPSALAYFVRQGYGVERLEDPAPAPAPVPAPPPGAPTRSASKADWLAYATSPEGGMTADAADALTRDQLAEKYLGPKES